MPLETPRNPRRRGSVRHGALGLLVAALLLTGCESQADKDKKAADAAYREKLAKAQAIFAERCKTAGVVIHRTVKDVEGIELKKIRPKLEFGDKRYFDPMFEGAAMAGDAQGDSFIASFLYSEVRNTYEPDRRGLIQPVHVKPAQNQALPANGYRYVEVAGIGEPVFRYSVDRNLTEEQWRVKGWANDLIRSEWAGTRARYAVDWEDLVDPNDRAHWIAGTQIRVIDQRNGEVIAQLTRFVWDSGFGVAGTGRWPWQHAGMRGACQDFCVRGIE